MSDGSATPTDGDSDLEELRRFAGTPLLRTRLFPRGPGGRKPSVLMLVHRWEILGNPYGLRGDLLPNVPSLAESIHQHGLLENLLGVEIPEHERIHREQWIQLKAGSRRLAAIDLLYSKGLLDLEHDLVPILLIDGDGFWEHVVENVQRVECKPWEIGRYLSEASDAGAHHRTIAARVNKSQGWVSRHIQIGKGIAPETIAYLSERRLDLNTAFLHRLSLLKDRYGDPDGKAQIEAIEKVRRRRKSPLKSDPGSLASFKNRLEYMKISMPVPPVLRPVVAAVMDYLELGQKPNFKALEGEVAKLATKFFGGEE
jgi:ParB-like chromosome segregation protein Spo0J